LPRLVAASAGLFRSRCKGNRRRRRLLACRVKGEEERQLLRHPSPRLGSISSPVSGEVWRGLVARQRRGEGCPPSGSVCLLSQIYPLGVAPGDGDTAGLAAGVPTIGVAPANPVLIVNKVSGSPLWPTRYSTRLAPSV
jgi:hypothetical protein